MAAENELTATKNRAMILYLIEKYRGAVAVLLATGWIVFLIAIDLIGAALGEWNLVGNDSAVIPEISTPGPPSSLPNSCLTMPDGLVVCDTP